MRPPVNAPTKNLVYTVAFGAPQYFQLAERMFRSLRISGWRGAAVCFSDRHHEFPAELDVTNWVHPPELAGTYAPDWKCKIRAFPVEQYHNVLFVDSDVLFLRNPAEYLGRDFEHVQVAEVGMNLSASRFNQLYFTPAERARIPADQVTINTGAVLLPGAVAGAFLAVWSAFHRAHRSPPEGVAITLCDQPALEVLLFRGILQAERMPRHFMEIAGHIEFADLNPTALFAHYLGNGNTLEAKDACLATMSAHLAELATKRAK